MMNHEERTFYTRSVIDLEFSGSVELLFPDPDVWVRNFLCVPSVDPLNVHKPYGLCTPQMVNGRWVMGVSVSHLLRPIEGLSDEEFNRWIEYWLTHMLMHFVVMAQAVDNDESDIPLDALERRVDDEMRNNEELYRFGERIKLLA